MSRSLFPGAIACARCAVLVLALLGASSWPVPARAAVVIDPRVMPQGTDAVMYVYGEASSIGGDHWSWSKLAEGTSVNESDMKCFEMDQFCTLGAVWFHRGYTTNSAGGVALRTLASMTAFSGGEVKTYGSTATMSSDMLTLETSAGNPGAATLKFSFVMDGQLTNNFLSPTGQSIDSPGGYALATYTRAELSMVTTLNLDNNILHVASQSVRDGRQPLTFLQEEFLDYLRFDQTRDNSDVFTFVDFEQRTDVLEVDRKEVFELVQGVQTGVPVWATITLATGYSLYVRELDFSELDITLDVDFEHTVELASVELFNADGTPYIGQWQLHSAAGIDYPELIRTSAAVAEPAPGVLSLLGLAALLARRRPAHGTRRA